MNVRLVFVISCTCLIKSCFGLNVFTSDAREIFNEWICGPSLYHFQDISGAIYCGTFCAKYSGCLGYFYSAELRTCRGIGVPLTSFDGCVSNTTYKFYRKSGSPTTTGATSTTVPPTTPQHYGGPCTQDVQCDMQRADSVCEQNQCQCAADRRYNPADASCVPECTTYGTTFTRFAGYKIATGSVSNQTFFNTELEQCKQHCIDDVTCRSFNFRLSPPDCYLKTVTKYEAPGEWVSTSIADNYIRNCD